MDIVNLVRSDLKNKYSKEREESSQRFFKERIKCYGLSSKDTSIISKKYFPQIENLDKNDTFRICEKMFLTGYLEEFMIAADWVYRIRAKFTKSDFLVFEKWVRKYIDNWAKCDLFCNHVLGSFIETYPSYINKLKTWAKSKNKWVRRASAVSLIIPARKGMFFKDIIEICDTLLLDNEDMVQKGYGWLLKVTADKKLDEVFKYVIKNKKIMPRTSLRYAIEKMPKDMRLKAMEK